MRNILKEILRLHKLWLDNDQSGKRADLRYADLHDADLYGANLSYANLYGANLYGANLSNADLSNANLSYANLRYADLHDADLYGANLSYANLSNADLSKANLFNANLCGANLRNANLRNADLCNADLSKANLFKANLCGAKNIPFLPQCQVCPEEGSFIGFKKVNNYIIKIEIPENAKRSSATTRKCRCEFAKVLSITDLDGNDSGLTEITNEYYKSCTYKIGEIVYPDSFDDDRWNKCSHGIHFFITRQEAIDYKI